MDRVKQDGNFLCLAVACKLLPLFALREQARLLSGHDLRQDIVVAIDLEYQAWTVNFFVHRADAGERVETAPSGAPANRSVLAAKVINPGGHLNAIRSECERDVRTNAESL